MKREEEEINSIIYDNKTLLVCCDIKLPAISQDSWCSMEEKKGFFSRGWDVEGGL